MAPAAPLPRARWSKSEFSLFLEYGVSDSTTLVAQTAFGDLRSSASPIRKDALEPTALGARFKLWSSHNQILSLQSTVRAPTLPVSAAPYFARGSSLGADLRILYSRSFIALARPTFVDIQTGWRLNGHEFEGAAHVDLTFGVRPIKRILLMAQSFARMGRLSPWCSKLSADDKAQLSLVYDFTEQWSAQIGAFATIAQVNAARERGALVAVWRRF
ncbi:MAG TPA: hypothetical protein VND97_03870 [Beijerinckiaceae bacterium]|nr:hypothetical protein [Beijerinckiaceae bacterium]